MTYSIQDSAAGQLSTRYVYMLIGPTSKLFTTGTGTCLAQPLGTNADCATLWMKIR